MESTYFDVNAKVPAGAGAKQIAAMLQSLLTERFEMRVRWETKLVDGWALVTGHSPLKIARTSLPGSPTDADPDGVPTRVVAFMHKAGTLSVVHKGISMQGLAKDLWVEVNEPVQDFTGLKGAFDITLEGDEESPASPVSVSSMRRALRACGLDLVRQKVQKTTLLIESASKKPKAN
jgi:uncharacterized protein (TIGR03435 family)